jgi:acyl carrier protein
VTDAEIRAVLGHVLGEIAPEADVSRLDPSADLRDQVDLDSFDLLNLMLGIQRALGVEIPESAYARLRSLDDVVAYLAAHGARDAR